MHTGQAREFSPFLDQLVRSHPQWLKDLEACGRLERCSPPRAVQLAANLRKSGLNTALRRFRNCEMMRLVWRDLNALAPLQETLSDLTALAEVCLQTTIEHHTATMEAKYGRPRDADGQHQKLVVLGLGKLGGGELNLSSDIDIIFCFPENGICDARSGLANEQFFTRLTRSVIHSLAEVTADGFCFRVDTRLRPFGASGPLVCSFAALEQYYQREGRDWERYALIKARPVAGDLREGQKLLQLLKPFVYRRYIDFGALEALREMHAGVREDAVRRERLDDIKRGPGGIREIEFLVQAFQLLRGGREPSLQTTSLLTALRALRVLQLLPEDAVVSLLLAYEFLRRTENRIQALHDQQSHRVPEGKDGLRVANAMGYATVSDFEAALEKIRLSVQGLFNLSLSTNHKPVAVDSQWQRLWQRLRNNIQGDAPIHMESPALAAFIERLGRLSLSQRASQRLDRFMPMLLERFDDLQPPQALQNRVYDLLSAICRRSAYLSLLVQNPFATERMLELFGRSKRVADVVTRYPALLDELIDPRLGASPPDREDIQAIVTKTLNAHKDTETTLQNLNYHKQASSLRIAVALLQSSLTASQAQTILSDLAQNVLQAVLSLAQKDMQARHGRLDGPEPAVIAYGSLGARVLTFDSDLDLIFLYQPVVGNSDGARPLPAERYHTGVARRMLGLLSAITPSGRLFSIDARLRPNGRAGLLLSSVTAFGRYQLEKAWLWELQALTRARAVAGDAAVAHLFTVARMKALTQEHDTQQLKIEISSMREKIDQKHQHADPLKYGHGGLLDIEFVTQLGLLSNTSAGEDLFQSTEIAQQLRALASFGWLKTDSCEILTDAYLRLNEARLSAALVDSGELQNVNHLLDLARPICDRLLRA